MWVIHSTLQVGLHVGRFRCRTVSRGGPGVPFGEDFGDLFRDIVWFLCGLKMPEML